jgi:hypothetical protein
MHAYPVDEAVLGEALDPAKSLDQRVEEAGDRATVAYVLEHERMPRPGEAITDPVTRTSVVPVPVPTDHLTQQAAVQQQAEHENRLRLQPPSAFRASIENDEWLIEDVLVKAPLRHRRLYEDDEDLAVDGTGGIAGLWAWGAIPESVPCGA